MLIKVITLSFNSALGCFDDSKLQEFLKNCEVISIRDHFFVRNEVPFLSLVIRYFPIRQELDPNLLPQGKRDESWRSTLGESEMGLFNILRDWRLKRSKKEGYPPYGYSNCARE